MKYPEEIEAVAKQARLLDESTPNEWARGVEEALIWVLGNGTTNALDHLIHDAQWERDMEGAWIAAEDTVDHAFDLLGADIDLPPQVEDIHDEYIRAVVEMVVRACGFDHDRGTGFVIRKLNLPPGTEARIYKIPEGVK